MLNSPDKKPASSGAGSVTAPAPLVNRLRDLVLDKETSILDSIGP